MGDYVDALGEFKTPSALKMNKVMKGWCPAKILLIDQNENMLVSFIGNSRKFDLKFNRWSDGIAPFRKYTDDFDWRFDLKEDDEFDVMDDYAIWYTSTVLDIFETDEFDCEGNKVNKIKIGCRYLDPEGIKEDHKGRRCTGWTDEKFNLICYLASPNLKRRGTMAT